MIRFMKAKCDSRGSCINKQTCWTAYEISGRVNVRYCKAPARLRYSVGSETGGPSDALSLDERSTGVLQGLQADMLARARISLAYCC
ncbi:hypothetical protein HanLR1_Chr15g0564671 [Helianthus annuus]|nr:hypothetical protein HanLR1_Chr15g0564671 [Helianthus annuus]